MKKLVFIIFASTLLSCNLIPPDTTVTNNSSYTVSFKYSNSNNDIIILEPNSTASSQYNFSSVIILQPDKRVMQSRKQSDNIIFISDLPSWEVRVENKSNDPIFLTADGWMDEMIVPSGDFINDENHVNQIYTKTPQFVVQSLTFPLDVQWQFINDIYYVVIRN